MELINKHIQSLIILSQKYFVKELFVIGSLARGQQNELSDIDFLVRFEGVPPIDYFDNYMDYKNSLEILFSKNVDLIEIQTIKNPILKKSIERDKIKIYEREDPKMAV